MIQARALSRSFGYLHALRDVDLDIQPGEFVTLVGPNGAGKTTLLRILATLLQPTSGKVVAFGLDLADAGLDIRRQIGFLSHQSLLYGHLTVEENLFFFGQLYQLPSLAERVNQLLTLHDLASRRHDMARTLSRGMLQRLSLARATLHDPALLLLDEPYTGLDQHASALLTRMLTGLKEAGRTILMTTHNLEHGLWASDRILVLRQGSIVHRSGTSGLSLQAFRDMYGRYTSDERSP